MSSRRHRSRRFGQARSHCRDCGLDVSTAGHWYMVRDSVWGASGLGPEEGVLCLPCLERRLGRLLRYEDFKPVDNVIRQSWRGHDRMLPRAWTRHVLDRSIRDADPS
jgi:hypothetical protein